MADSHLVDSTSRYEDVVVVDSYPYITTDIITGQINDITYDEDFNMSRDTIKNLNIVIDTKDEKIKELKLKVKELEEELEDIEKNKYTKNRMEKILD